MRIKSKTEETQLIIYGGHRFVLILMCLGRWLIKWVDKAYRERGQFIGQPPFPNIIVEKRFIFLVWSVLITLMFTMLNSVIMDAHSYCPWGLVQSVVVRTVTVPVPVPVPMI